METHVRRLIVRAVSLTIGTLMLEFGAIGGLSYFVGIQVLQTSGWLGVGLVVILAIVTGLFGSLIELLGLLSRQMSGEFADTLETPTMLIPKILHELKPLWFGENVSQIFVVGPESLTKTKFSNVKSNNYVYLDRLGDKDSILEIMTLLSKLYPFATIRKFMDKDFPTSMLEENLVVVGGPGSPDDVGNSLCSMLSQKVHSNVTYSDDCEEMRLSGDQPRRAI